MSKYYSSSIAFGADQTKTEKVVVNQNKIGDVTTDAVSGALTVDEVPVLNSLNPVSSDGVARAVIQAGAELPTRGSTDTGKVLTVKNSDGDLEWDTPATVTVDQTYNASSTNPQSGVAVASAISAIPSEVTTASGYFRLAGSTPVKVRYTGSAEPVVVPESLDVDNHTKYNGASTASNQTIFIWFDNTNGLKDLGSSYTATLKMKAASLLTGFPAGVTVTGTSQVMYCPSSSWDATTGPGITNGRLAVTNNDIEEQTVTLSGSNPAVASGYGAYIGFYISINNARNPDTQQFYDLSDALDALITNIEAGDVFELAWPCESAGTDMLATIPNIPDNANQSDKFLKTVQTGASTWEMQWATVNQVPVSSSYDSGKVLTVYSNGTPRWQTLTLPPTLTAGDGIKIADDEISLDYGSTLAPSSTSVSGTFTAPGDTLDTTSTTYYYSYAYGCGTPVTSDIAALANNGGSATIAFSASGSNMFTLPSTAPQAGIFFLYNKTDTTKCIVIKSSETSVADMFGYYYYVSIYSGLSIDLDFSDVVCYGGASLSDVSVGDWYLGFGAKGTNYACPTTTTAHWGALFGGSGNLTVPTNTLTGSYPGSIEVVNPLPASTSLDENKVLTVNSSGDAVWGNVTLGSVQNIQQVNALPANPDANTLYLIPEN